jgi:hypothetical protein
MLTATILIIAAVFLIGIGLGAMIILVVLRRRQPPLKPRPAPASFVPIIATSHETQPKPIIKHEPETFSKSYPLVFRLSYVAAPLILAGMCSLIAVGFVASLPDPLPFRFDSNETILTSMNKYAFVILMVALQFIAALIAIVIAQTIVKVSKNMFKASEAPTKLDGFVSLMSNMVLLPQVILAYLMLDAFIYGTWSVHLVSFTLFAILAVAIGSLVIIYMFTRLSASARSAINKQ